MQVTLSLYGADIPVGFTAGAASKRRTIWEIAAPYALTSDDMATVQTTSPGHVDLWLTTFTNSLKGILIKLFRKTKEHARHYFPDSEYVPKAYAAALVGLPAGRKVCIVAYPLFPKVLCIYIVVRQVDESRRRTQIIESNAPS